MWVGGVARHVTNDAQLAAWRRKRCLVDERRYLGGEVNAVDEDVGLDDLLIWAGLGLGFWQIPFLSTS